MTRYYLGFDAGATKSHALIADETGKVLGFGQAGPGNPDEVDYEGLAQVLQAASQAALGQAGLGPAQIAGAGFGIAGFDWPSQRQSMMEAIASLELEGSVTLVNDALIALMAGARKGWGVAVVAGTSCNAWGWDPDLREGRMAGFSWMGEAAGGGELVLEAVRAVAKAWTRRAPATQLSHVFVTQVGAVDAADLIEGLSQGRYMLTPADAPLVFQTAEAGDRVAQDLVLWAGRELGDLATGIIRQLDLQPLEFDVVLGGSFFQGSPILAQQLATTIQTIAPGAQLVPLSSPPVMGGVLLGMREAGCGPEAIQQARERIEAQAPLW